MLLSLINERLEKYCSSSFQVGPRQDTKVATYRRVSPIRNNYRTSWRHVRSLVLPRGSISATIVECISQEHPGHGFGDPAPYTSGMDPLVTDASADAMYKVFLKLGSPVAP